MTLATLVLLCLIAAFVMCAATWLLETFGPKEWRR